MLNELYKKYKESGLEVLAFPCNQFGAQEAGTDAEIQDFAKSLGVEFRVFQKVDVNGSKQHPLFDYLKEEQKGFVTDGIKWNFSMFLTDRDGVPVKRYSPGTKLEAIEKDLLEVLEKPATPHASK